MKQGIFLFALLLAGQAGAVVIDFNDMDAPLHGEKNNVIPYTEDGYHFTDNASKDYHYSRISEYRAHRKPDNSPYLGLLGYNIEAPYPYTLTMAGPAPFDVHSFQVLDWVHDWDPGEMTDLELYLTGHRADGGSVERFFTDFVHDTWYDLSLENFTGLSSFSIAGGGAGSTLPGNEVGFDNIVVTPTGVPLPSSLILLAIGLMGMGLNNRLCRNSH